MTMCPSISLWPYRTHHWKPKFIMKPTLSSLMSPVLYQPFVLELSIFFESWKKIPQFQKIITAHHIINTQINSPIFIQVTWHCGLQAPPPVKPATLCVPWWPGLTSMPGRTTPVPCHMPLFVKLVGRDRKAFRITAPCVWLNKQPSYRWIELDWMCFTTTHVLQDIWCHPKQLRVSSNYL